MRCAYQWKLREIYPNHNMNTQQKQVLLFIHVLHCQLWSKKWFHINYTMMPFIPFQNKMTNQILMQFVVSNVFFWIMNYCIWCIINKIVEINFFNLFTLISPTDIFTGILPDLIWKNLWIQDGYISSSKFTMQIFYHSSSAIWGLA